MKLLPIFLGLLALLVGCAHAPTRDTTIAFSAAGTSMLPTIHPGDIAVPDWSEFDQVRKGDICVYWMPGCWEPVSHRAVRKLRAGWVMQGDNNPVPDPAPMSRQTFICRLGRILSADRLASN